MSRSPSRISTVLLTVLAMVIAMATAALGSGAAVAATPPDPAKVPHYFGPWPNWANSPLTLNKASVTFDGTGTGATAVAQVDPAHRRHHEPSTSPLPDMATTPPRR